jgi:cytochrome P450
VSDTSLESYVYPIGRSASNVLTVVPAVHRDPSLFHPFPESFWPERWLPNGPALAKEMGHDFELAEEACIPFHYGTHIGISE